MPAELLPSPAPPPPSPASPLPSPAAESTAVAAGGGTLSRRTLLHSVALGGALGSALATTGCGTREAPKSHPDVAILVGVIASEERLVALYDGVRRAHADLADTIDPVLTHHREHLAALRRHFRPGSGPRTRTRTAPRPSPAPLSVPDDQEEAVTRLRSAERTAAAARGAETTKASPALAQLLASIGACEAGHDVTLARLA